MNKREWILLFVALLKFEKKKHTNHFFKFSFLVMMNTKKSHWGLYFTLWQIEMLYYLFINWLSDLQFIFALQHVLCASKKKHSRNLNWLMHYKFYSIRKKSIVLINGHQNAAQKCVVQFQKNWPNFQIKWNLTHWCNFALK